MVDDTLRLGRGFRIAPKGLTSAVAMAKLLRKISTGPAILVLRGHSSFPILPPRFITLQPIIPLNTTTPNPYSLPTSISHSNWCSNTFFYGTRRNESQMEIFSAQSGMGGSFSALARRFYGAESSNLDYSHEIDEINAKFAEAREEIDMALESKETIYFNEEAEAAKAAAKAALDMFDALLAKLPDSERGAVQRSMGLKMEQLKAEVEQLNE